MFMTFDVTCVATRDVGQQLPPMITHDVTMTVATSAIPDDVWPSCRRDI